MGYKDSVLADSPRVYLPFTSDSLSTNLGSKTGVTVTDSGGFNWGAGIADRAPDFTGPSTAAHVTYGLTNDIFSGSTWTVEAWFKRNTSQSDYANIFFTSGGLSQIQLFLWNSTTTDARKLIARYKDTGGNVQTIKSTAGITDTNWHHAVLTTNGTTVTLYLDGVSQGTGTHYSQSGISSSDPIRLGSYGTSSAQENFYGAIDEVAMYNTNLSSTRVSAHYAARLSVDGGYTAQAATSTSTMPGGVAVGHPLKVTTDFNDQITHLTHTRTTGTTNQFSLTTGDIVFTGTGSTYVGKFYFEEFPIASGGEMLFRITANTGVTIGGYTSNWNGSTYVDTFFAETTGANRYIRIGRSGSTMRYKTWSIGSAEPGSWTNVATLNANDPVIGFRASVPSSVGVTATIDYMAVNELVAVALPDVAVIETPATASALMVSPTVSLTTSINYAVSPATSTALAVDPAFSNATVLNVTADVATGSALMVDPTVSLVRNINVAVEPAVSTGLMTGGGFSVPNTVAASPATGSAEAPDASVTAERNAVVSVPASIATGVLPGILLYVNDVEVDPELASDLYRARIVATTDADDFWYRLDETSGTVLHDARGLAEKDADLFGSYSFNIYGPESRKAMRFTDGYAKRQYAQENYTGVEGLSPYDESDTTQFAFEIVIRTTDGNGMLAYGIDRANPSVELGTVPLFRNSIYLKNGKVSTNWNYANRTDAAFEFSGNANVADGNWHHIVVAFNSGNESSLNSGLRIYVDGKLDIRRREAVVPGLWASPDSYFGMPEAWRNETTLYPWQKNFNGDVMEVVFRYEDSLNSDNVQDLYYDSMGIVPIRVTPATASGFMPEPTGRGNQKRALVLYTRWYGAGNTGNLAGDERNAPSSYSTTIPDAFDHEIQIGRVFEPGENQWIDLAGFRVMPVTIMREDSNPLGGPYRDPVTDLPRLLNLQEDLNLDEYDVILFRNWPDEGADLEVFSSRGYDNQAIEAFLNSVKQAVVDGKSLEVTNPNLAARLGLISGAQPIPMLVDRNAGVNAGEKDLRGSAVNPWDVDKLGNTYMDIHANNWHRVVANVENLTDLPDAERITEAYLTYNDGTNGQVNNQWGYKLEAGDLQIGDEIIDPVQFVNRITTYDQSGNVLERPWDKYLWAITPDGLSVGTPLYKFGTTMWAGNTEVDNPYREFIGGAIVQPGDVWDGQQIAGKVFINLAESPYTALKGSEVMARQIVPPNDEIVNPLEKEDATKREWDYAFSRVAFSAKGVLGASSPGDETFEQFTASDGSIYYKAVVTSSQMGLVGIEISEKYDIESVLTPSWALRGMAWLASTEEVSSGSVTIRTTAATATGAMPNPAALAQRSVTVNAQAAIALGQMVSPDEVVEPNVTILVFPAEASGVMTGYGKTIAVAPFEGSGELVDNFDLISASGEQVVLYLHGLQEVELYLMEGTK